jgi:hypothetical protein
VRLPGALRPALTLARREGTVRVHLALELGEEGFTSRLCEFARVVPRKPGVGSDAPSPRHLFAIELEGNDDGGTL